MSLVAASTRGRSAGRQPGLRMQQFGQRGGPRLMHGRAHSHLDGFQIQTPRLAATVEDDAQQLVYFARDFLPDGFGRFFSSGERVSATGRARQIFSFTSSNS